MRWAKILTIEISDDATVDEARLETFLSESLVRGLETLAGASSVELAFTPPEIPAGIDPLDFIYDSAGTVLGPNPARAGRIESENQIHVTITDGVDTHDEAGV